MTGRSKVWDAEKGQELLALAHPGRVWCVAFSPDGRRIASGGPDIRVTVWSEEKGQEVLVLKGHTNMVTSVAFRQTANAFSPGTAGRTCWHGRLPMVSRLSLSMHHRSPLPGPARSPDGFRHAMPQGNTIAVTDRAPASEGQRLAVPDGAAERKRYHTEQADRAVQQKQWFAAGFHLGRVLRDDPENAAVQTRLAQMRFNSAYGEKRFADAVRLWIEALEETLNSATTPCCRPATTPPAPRPWPQPARARMSLRSMTRRKRHFAAKPSTG